MKQLSLGLIFATVFMLGLTACEHPYFASGIGVLNSTDIDLHFKITADGRLWDLGTIERHQSGILIPASNDDSRLTNNCTTSDLVAYAPDGTEYARHSPPLCSSASVIWVIEDSLPFPS